MKKRMLVGAVLSLSTLALAGIGLLAGIGPLARVGFARAGAGLGLTLTDEKQDKLLAAGKKTFVERCAKCHDERGDKALRTGLPLSERDLSDEEITRAVAGRLKNAPDEEKRAVALYVSSFMKRK